MPHEDDGNPESRALRSLVRRGAAWSVVAHAGAQLLRFVSNLLLARLLLPEAFGLMAIVNALLVGLTLFSDIGIGPSIIQSARGADPAYLNTAWTVQVVRGVSLWLISCAIALPAATFYEDPRLAAFVAVSGLTALIGGFNSTRLHSMYRDVKLARVSLIDFGSQACGLLTVVTWALVSPSPWALVAGGIAGSLVELVLSHTALPGLRNRLQVDRSALTQLVRFGRWIFLSTALTFLVMQSDRLVFGKLVDPATLGLYAFAMSITSAPVMLLSRIESSVFMPVFSRVHNARGDLQAVYERVRWPWLVVAGWVLAGLCGGGQAAVDMLWPERWTEAGWMTQLLALGAWFSVLEMTNGAALLARGHAKWVAAGNAGKLASMLVFIPLGLRLDGFRGAVVGIVVSEAVRYVVSAGAVMRTGLRGWPRDLRLTLWLLATAALGWRCALYASDAGWPAVGGAALVFVAVTLAWAPLLLPVVAGLRRPREPAADAVGAARGGRAGMRVAYFTSQYPKVSHTFIRREIAGIEEAGLDVLRISVRRCDDELVDDLDRAELGRTRVLLDHGAVGLLPDLLWMLVRHPVRVLRALRIAAAMGWKAPQGLTRHLAYLAEACRLLRWSRDEGVDHIHVHFSTNPADVALLCRELGGPPFSFTAHRVQVGTPSSSSIARKVAAASFVVAICEEGRDRLLERARPEDAQKIRVVRCGVDGQFLRPAQPVAPGSRRLVCVARHCPEKGLFVLLRAAARLVREGVRFELSLVGDGPDRPALEAAARELGLSGCVRFEGWASRDEVREHIAASRALVLSSFEEGLPVVLMEALGMHRPVIATAVNGVPELVQHGVCGWLVRAGSDADLAAAMREALTLPASELDEMGARGAQRVATVHDPILQVRTMSRLLLDSRPSRDTVRSAPT